MNFNLNQAITLANWSNLAYGNPIPSTVDYRWVSGLPKSDTQCLVIKQSDKIIFAFRGTNDFRKFLIDASVKFKHLGNGIKVHTGFYMALDSVWDELSKIAKNTRLPIITTGHSLGGALARIFTYRLATEAHVKVACSVTFGEPRSFNYKGATLYNILDIPTYRIEDGADVVCNIPWFLGSYWHVNENVYIDSWLNLNISQPWYAHLISDSYEIIKGLLHRKDVFIGDHSIQLYYDKLQKIQNNFN